MRHLNQDLGWMTAPSRQKTQQRLGARVPVQLCGAEWRSWAIRRTSISVGDAERLLQSIQPIAACLAAKFLVCQQGFAGYFVQRCGQNIPPAVLERGLLKKWMLWRSLVDSNLAKDAGRRVRRFANRPYTSGEDRRLSLSFRRRVTLSQVPH